MLMASHQLVMINSQLNLYNTDPVVNGDWLQFDCLHYYVTSEELVYQDLSNLIVNTIPYCIRPINPIVALVEDFIDKRSQNMSFEELRLMNITSEDLLLWSGTIDVAEQYQLYLNEPISSLNQVFYNCTPPWFGSRCQYLLEVTGSMSVNQAIQATFQRRRPYNESSDLMIPLPCYVGIQCNRGGSLLCLDWREVCNGLIECLDGGLDEEFCFEMELNKCAEHEYRCHNGLCIPEELWNDGLGNADCLDRSDGPDDVTYRTSCFRDPTFQCEEHMCRATNIDFPCADGECAQKASQCHNGRHALLLHSFTVPGDLSDKCWIAMSCLTKLLTQINEISCKIWLTDIIELLKNCPSLFQFPTIPIHFDHIRLFYHNLLSRLNTSQAWFPDYICYDQQLCPFIKATFTDGDLTCLLSEDVLSYWGVSEMISPSWTYIFMVIDYEFRGCLISSRKIVDEMTLRDHPSLYQCRNSTKFISHSRIRDRIQDCYHNDDETRNDTCLLKDKFRVKCPSDNTCLSPSVTIDSCSLAIDRYKMKIPFEIVCDGSEDLMFVDSQGRIYTDESECLKSEWPCENLYTRCDQIWTCPDGGDEACCKQSMCSRGKHACISPINFTLICLPSALVGNGYDDCLGGSDEFFCQKRFSSITSPQGFHCINSSRCLISSNLCDGQRDCLFGDDEEFCAYHQRNCSKDFVNNRTEEEDLFCRLGENHNNNAHYFSLDTSSDYPFEVNIPIGREALPVRMPDTSESNLTSINENNLWPWYCNRGLQLVRWSKNDNHEPVCLCPPSYYGHLCQYQSDRVSLTLGFVESYQQNAYNILIMLLDHHQVIHSFDQFVYITKQSCSTKVNRYLLYSTRLKDRLKNYSVRIDAFSKATLSYHGSWYFEISFLFLPVNRLAVMLDVPSFPVSVSSICLETCEHGQCMNYIENEKRFCHCFSGWSGIRCDQKINCTSCASDSICAGQVNGLPICVCPMDRYGPRCLLQSSCAINACQNGGQCVPASTAESRGTYTCICPSAFHGSRCQYSKGNLEVSLDAILIPSYVHAFLFTISNQSEPESTTMLQKLTLFQRVVTFQLSVPFHLVYIKADQYYYLAVVQKHAKLNIATSINPERRCMPIEELLNSTVLALDRLRRVQYYQGPCQQHQRLVCFVDESYLCLCTKERHANCLTVHRDRNLKCSSRYSCANGAQCLRDRPACPFSTICACRNCFFGDKCQFYAKGFGWTLDEILGYEIKRDTSLFDQPYSVQLSAIITMLMFVMGIINAILAIVAFKKNTDVGCGVYLFASSLTSLLVVIWFTLKFWFLFLSHMDSSFQQIILYTNCMVIEPLLKALLQLNNWLNGLIALERAWIVFKGIGYKQKKSKQVAKWTIFFLIFMILTLLAPYLSHIHLFNDKKEERSWCVVRYSSSLQWYSSAIIFFHVVGPFAINLFSSIFIIVQTARLQNIARHTRRYFKHFKSKLKQFQHLLITPVALVILSLPYLTISLTLDCSKSSRNFYFYLSGYFVSFIPSILGFVIFFLPLHVYRQQFRCLFHRKKHRKQRP